MEKIIAGQQVEKDKSSSNEVPNVVSTLGNADSSPTIAATSSTAQSRLLQNADPELLNYQRASATLDASIKIWSYRVDDVWTSSYRVLENMGRNADSTNKGDETSKDWDVTGNENEEEERNSSKRKNVDISGNSTIEKNLANITIKAVESALEGDPIFSRLASASGYAEEGGAGGSLLLQLPVRDGCTLVLDDTENARESRSYGGFTIPTMVPPKDSIDKVLSLLRPTFSDDFSASLHASLKNSIADLGLIPEDQLQLVEEEFLPDFEISKDNASETGEDTRIKPRYDMESSKILETIHALDLAPSAGILTSTLYHFAQEADEPHLVEIEKLSKEFGFLLTHNDLQGRSIPAAAPSSQSLPDSIASPAAQLSSASANPLSPSVFTPEKLPTVEKVRTSLEGALPHSPAWAELATGEDEDLFLFDVNDDGDAGLLGFSDDVGAGDMPFDDIGPGNDPNEEGKTDSGTAPHGKKSTWNPLVGEILGQVIEPMVDSKILLTDLTKMGSSAFRTPQVVFDWGALQQLASGKRNTSRRGHWRYSEAVKAAAAAASTDTPIGLHTRGGSKTPASKASKRTNAKDTKKKGSLVSFSADTPVDESLFALEKPVTVVAESRFEKRMQQAVEHGRKIASLATTYLALHDPLLHGAYAKKKEIPVVQRTATQLGPLVLENQIKQGLHRNILHAQERLWQAIPPSLCNIRALPLLDLSLRLSTIPGLYLTPHSYDATQHTSGPNYLQQSLFPGRDTLPNAYFQWLQSLSKASDKEPVKSFSAAFGDQDDCDPGWGGDCWDNGSIGDDGPSPSPQADEFEALLHTDNFLSSIQEEAAAETGPKLKRTIELTKAARIVPKTRVRFETTAKRVDVHALKRGFSRWLTDGGDAADALKTTSEHKLPALSHSVLEKTNQASAKLHESSFFDSSLCNKADSGVLSESKDRQDVLRELGAGGATLTGAIADLSETFPTEVTVPFYFITLLHLANEEGLAMFAQEGLDDITIKALD